MLRCGSRAVSHPYWPGNTWVVRGTTPRIRAVSDAFRLLRNCQIATLGELAFQFGPGKYRGKVVGRGSKWCRVSRDARGSGSACCSVRSVGDAAIGRSFGAYPISLPDDGPGY